MGFRYELSDFDNDGNFVGDKPYDPEPAKRLRSWLMPNPEQDELVEAGCKALKPALFAHGLGGREGDGPATRAHMDDIARDVQKVLRAITPLITKEAERALLEEMREWARGLVPKNVAYPHEAAIANKWTNIANGASTFAKEKRGYDLSEGEG